MPFVNRAGTETALGIQFYHWWLIKRQASKANKTTEHTSRMTHMQTHVHQCT